MKQPVISEDKKEILMDLINRMGSAINNIYSTIEDDVNIPPDDYEEYEKQIERMYSILQDLESEVIFT